MCARCVVRPCTRNVYTVYIVYLRWEASSLGFSFHSEYACLLLFRSSKDIYWKIGLKRENIDAHVFTKEFK